jgi:hypothetical protein
MKAITLVLLSVVVTWKLPQDLAVRDNGPRTYRFTVDYTYTHTDGEIARRERVSGDYTRGLPEGKVIWRNVTVAQASGAAAPFGEPSKQDYMEGFEYKNTPGNGSLQAEFFKAFPPAAIQGRNLVWDVQMIELFGQTQFEHLQLNQPFHLASEGALDLAGAGKFQNKNIELMWTGRSQRNGQECVLISYRALFNPLSIATPGMTMKGRSNYWGEIWVSTFTKQIEYATLYEDVLGEVRVAQQEKPMVVDVVRSGVFKPR